MNAASDPQPQLPAESTAAVFDPSVLGALPMVADGTQPELADRLIAMFVDSMHATEQAIGQAIAQGDMHALQRQLHSMKSSAATVGALALAAWARRNEALLKAGAALAPGLARELGDEFSRFLVRLGRSGGGGADRIAGR